MTKLPQHLFSSASMVTLLTFGMWGYNPNDAEAMLMAPACTTCNDTEDPSDGQPPRVVRPVVPPVHPVHPVGGHVPPVVPVAPVAPGSVVGPLVICTALVQNTGGDEGNMNYTCNILSVTFANGNPVPLNAAVQPKPGGPQAVSGGSLAGRWGYVSVPNGSYGSQASCQAAVSAYCSQFTNNTQGQIQVGNNNISTLPTSNQ
jgi:hypothetical protein